MSRRRALAGLTGLGLGLSALAGGGCGDPLPSSQRIATPRVLAIRADVVAPLLPESDPEAAPRCQALPFEGVRLTPFLVDPTGPLSPATLAPIYLACELSPIQGLFACLKDASPTDLASLPPCPEPSFLDLDPEAEAPPSEAGPCVLPPADDEGRQTLTIPFAASLLAGGDLEVTMIGHVDGLGDDLSTTACADLLLSGDTAIPESCVYVVQRVSVGPVERLLLLAASFGIELPPELFGELPDPEAIPDSDRNPRIESFNAERIRADGSVDDLGPVAAGDTITAAAGDTLRLTTVTPTSDLQSYLVPVNNGESFEPRDESLRGRWFVSWGRLLSGTSDDPESFNEWELAPREDQEEPGRPEDDTATLFYVLRDTRQGVDWWWLRLQLTSDP